MRIGYITYYNTPDNLRIALEDNLIEISAKNTENHKLRIKHFCSNRPTVQCGLLCYVMYVSMMFTLFSILQVWDELLFPTSSLIHDTTVNLVTHYVK